MNRVEIRAEEVQLPAWVKKAENYIQLVLSSLGQDNWDLSVLLCGNKYIKSLNKEYRNKDEATDVLSFPLGEKNRTGRFIAGDIVISLDALEENTEYFNVSRDEELRRLLIHAILHLTGEDHGTNKPEEAMLKTQEDLLNNIKAGIITAH